MYLPDVTKALKEIVDDSVTKAWEEMPDNAIVSMDGSWDHRWNGKTMILDLIYDIIKNFECYHTTNFNENFHSIKAHLLPKNNFQGYWAIGRILAAILQYNYPDFWIFKLFDYFHLAAFPISILKKILQIFKQNQDKRNINNTLKYKKKLRLLKAVRRRQISKDMSSLNTLAHPYKSGGDE